MARTAWYRLDNVGKFYAAQAGRPGQTVFRIAAEMTEPVDPALLQQALDATLKMFPGFNVMLRSGLFWHYLEQASAPIRIHEEAEPICARMHTGRASVLTRVSYYERRINVEVSHMISDGRGTMELLTTLIGHYVQLRYGVIDAVPPYVGKDANKTEDSFSRNYERSASGTDKAPKPFQLHGWKDAATPTYLEYHVSASAMHAQAKAMGVSVTSLLIATIICAIRHEMPPEERDRAIRLTVPVDLRRFFGSTTLRNFFGLAYVSYTPGLEDEPLSAVAAQVQEQLSNATEAPAIKRRMNKMIKLEKNPLVRMVPLIVKDAVLGLAARAANHEVTTVASSLGVIRLPEASTPFVRSMSAITSTTGLNFIACTFADDMCITISSIFVSHRVPRRFVGILADLGIHGTLHVSKDAAEVDAQLKSANLERRLTSISSSWLEGRHR